MLLLDVAGEKVKIKPYGGQARMSQYSLQAEDIATVGQIPFREGVTTSMRRASHPGDSGALGKSSHHLLDTASG